MQGTAEIINYLKDLGPEHLQLILEFSKWPLQTTPREGLAVWLSLILLASKRRLFLTLVTTIDFHRAGWQGLTGRHRARAFERYRTQSCHTVSRIRHPQAGREKRSIPQRADHQLPRYNHESSERSGLQAAAMYIELMNIYILTSLFISWACHRWH
jgi:hypothetical protein